MLKSFGTEPPLRPVLLSWFALYRWAEPASSLIVFELLGLSPASRTGAALHVFLYDSTKIRFCSC